jgi:hypothetical protein
VRTGPLNRRSVAAAVTRRTLLGHGVCRFVTSLATFRLVTSSATRFRKACSPRRFATLGTCWCGDCTVSRGIPGEQLGQFLEQNRFGSRDARTLGLRLHAAQSLRTMPKAFTTRVQEFSAR